MPSYRNIRFADLIVLLKNRLQNISFWTDIEYRTNLNEALSLLQISSLTWRARFAVTTIAGLVFYDLTSLPGTLDADGNPQILMPLRVAFNSNPLSFSSIGDTDSAIIGWQAQTTTAGAPDEPQFWGTLGLNYLYIWPADAVGNNCFARNTSVWMADRSWKPIQEVAVGDYVMTLDENSFLVSREVTHTYRKNDSRPWVKVNIIGMKAKRWGSFGIICTPDHEWYVTPSLKVQARFLRKGEKVILPLQGNQSLIHGTILGDAHVTERNRLCISQSNEEWIRAKAENFGITYAPRKNPGGFENSGPAWQATVLVGGHWRKMFYRKDRSKRWIPPPDDAALAVFYGDDGCHHDRKKENKASAANFACQSFMQDIEAVRDWFWLRFGPCTISNGNIKLRKEASARFFETVAPYLHPSMEYKLPQEFRGRYNGWMSAATSQTGEVESVQPHVINKKRVKSKFCIEVKDTHRFFTRGGLVSNSLAIDAAVRAPQYALDGSEDAEFVDIDSAMISQLLDYAQHVCQQKRGNQMLFATMPKLKSFMRAISTTNSLFLASSIFKTDYALQSDRKNRLAGDFSGRATPARYR